MNPIQVKLKVYAYSIAALSVISLVLRAICLLFAFDENLHYFSYTSPLPAIANAILVLSLVWAASSFVFIPRGTLRPVLPELSTPSVFACALCGFIFLFFGGQDLFNFLRSGYFPGTSSMNLNRDLVLHIISMASGLLGSVYFFTALKPVLVRKGWRIFLGFFPVIWAVIKLAQCYFDFTHPMNEPVKVSVLLALIATMLALLQELRMLLDRHQPAIAFFFGQAAVLLCGVGGISGLIAYAKQPVMADYGTLFITLSALWLYFLFGAFAYVRAQLNSPAEASAPSETESERTE